MREAWGRSLEGLLLLLGMLLFPWGCRPAPGVPPGMTPQGAPDLLGRGTPPGGTTPFPTALPTPMPTPPLQQGVEDGIATPAAGPTVAVAPFAALFPTPSLPPEVAPWRPPTYPLPWAPTPYDHFVLVPPIPAFYGALPLVEYRYGGVDGVRSVHTGLDIPSRQGTPVLAAGPGEVVWAGYGYYYGYERQDDPYGLAVAIRHPFGWQGQPLYTVYAHLSRVLVERGQWVARGTPIGLVGSTGHSSGPHLHFEVRLGSLEGQDAFFTTRNPELWIVPPIGWGVLVGRVLSTGGRPLAHHVVRIISADGERNLRTYTYGAGIQGADPYYRENYTFGDLPAGRYLIQIRYIWRVLEQEVEIRPGQVTYFVFRGYDGFQVGLPSPPAATATP